LSSNWFKRYPKKCNVASGEQGFLQKIIDSDLWYGKYVCATPCFRPWDKNKSEHHNDQFFKVELIHLTCQDNFWHHRLILKSLIEDAVGFMNRYVACRPFPVSDEKRKCYTRLAYDIVRESDHLELGSYGIRNYKNINWIYGTGAALPRLRMGINDAK
jgi:hypothetical protein